MSVFEARMFTASNIKVDVVDKDATIARKHAMANGQSLGLFKVLERIVDKKQFENLPEISDDEISDMVLDISVSDEKTSKIRYIASLDIRYKPEAIHNYLKNIGISFVQSPSQPYLLLPLYYEKKEVFLWESLNSWALAWRNADSSLIPMIIPDADDTNTNTNITVSDVVNFTPELLNKWQESYKTAGVIIAEVRNSGNNLRFTATKYQNGKEIESIQMNEAVDNDLSLALKNLVKNYVEKTELSYRDENVVNIADDTFITAVIPLSSISDWLMVEKKLKQISTITKIELKAMSKTRAQIELWFADGLENLGKSLNTNGLKITEISSEIYEINFGTENSISIENPAEDNENIESIEGVENNNTEITEEEAGND